MPTQTQKTAVGAFILGGIALLLMGIAVLGGGRLFSHDAEYVLFFDGSVSGLQIGSPVVFRGVPMGSVTRIALEGRPGGDEPTIPVYVRLKEDSMEWAGGAPNGEWQREVLRRMIQRGLRARLQLQSLVTGQFRIELDFVPNSPAHFRSATPDAEIPTLPSPIDQLQRSLSSLPLTKMAGSVDVILESLAHTAASGSLDKALSSFTNLCIETQRIVSGFSALQAESLEAAKRLNGALATTSADLPQAIASFRAAMQNLEVATRSAQQTFGPNSATMDEVRRMLREASTAMRALRAFADTLERNPESLLYGKQGRR